MPTTPHNSTGGQNDSPHHHIASEIHSGATPNASYTSALRRPHTVSSYHRLRTHTVIRSTQSLRPHTATSVTHATHTALLESNTLKQRISNHICKNILVQIYSKRQRSQNSSLYFPPRLHPHRLPPTSIISAAHGNNLDPHARPQH